MPPPSPTPSAPGSNPTRPPPAARPWSDASGAACASIVANPTALVGLLIVVALILMAIFAPLLTFGQDRRSSRIWRTASRRHRRRTGSAPTNSAAISMSRTLYGARVTLTIVILVSVVVAPIGLAVGTVAGYIGGWVDAVLMRITDIFLAFPRLVLALAFAAALGPGIENAVIAISLTAWPPYARIARSEAADHRAQRLHRGGGCRAPRPGASCSGTSCRSACPR